MSLKVLFATAVLEFGLALVRFLTRRLSRSPVRRQLTDNWELIPYDFRIEWLGDDQRRVKLRVADLLNSDHNVDKGVQPPKISDTHSGEL